MVLGSVPGGVWARAPAAQSSSVEVSACMMILMILMILEAVRVSVEQGREILDSWMGLRLNFIEPVLN